MRTRDYDSYGRVVAVCRTDVGELNAAMVRRGWAVDFTKYSYGRYRSDEEQARREGLRAAKGWGFGPVGLRCHGNGGIGIEDDTDCARRE